ncbi:dihydrodipicolinate synthase family protein [Gymnodinialimonas ceratoperidinii]|uniref:Dihydrodipicolinate synthase family protein n=1 Tax=Gymnodinialimonas ceratoperidinii TaxID=2856823 RepID=A0A8F6TWG1_9RHOB|nr:dihydrodipicolinate synthase family protein [Gymnodinialimonas ceratoperidinii]QXT39439.1 dihydrodipicolinate synthase family protein [Gymnodinialimonas ceratoperidinii]
MTLFTGLSAFPLTPTDDEGQLKPELLQRFLERIVAAGADSIGLLGSTGGYAYLIPEERKRTLRAAVDCVAGRTPLIVGIGALTTDVAENLARDARQAGADGLLLAPMSYQPLTDDEVFRHFEAVAAAGELPLCIYNNPGTTKFTFSPDLIARLAEISNVAAVKMPLPADSDYAGEMRSLRAVTPDGFAVGYSGDWGAKDALLAGGACWYSVVAGLLPEPALALTRASQAGNAAEAERIDHAFAPLWALFREFGSFRVMFTIAEILGLGRITPPRPTLPLEPASRERVEVALRPLLQDAV